MSTKRKKYQPTGWLSASRMRAKAVFIVDILDRTYAHRSRYDAKPSAKEIAYLEETLKHTVKWLYLHYADLENEIQNGEIPEP